MTKEEMYDEFTQRIIDCDDRCLAIMDAAIFWTHKEEIRDAAVWNAMAALLLNFDIKDEEIEAATQLMRAGR